jgi:hypothetical protein
MELYKEMPWKTLAFNLRILVRLYHIAWRLMCTRGMYLDFEHETCRRFSYELLFS